MVFSQSDSKIPPEDDFREKFLSLEQEYQAMLYAISHDLRAPTRHIDGLVGMALNRAGDQLDEKSRECLERVGTSVARLNSYLDALVRFSRLYSQPETPAEIDLDGMVGELTGRFLASAMRETGAEIEYQNLGTITGCRGAIGGMLEAVLHNCLIHTKDKPRIQIRSERKGEEVLLYIADEGPGVNPKYLTNLCKPFYRVNVENRDSLGIGLSFAKKVAEMHGGSLQVYNREIEPGLEVLISLPVSGGN